MVSHLFAPDVLTVKGPVRHLTPSHGFPQRRRSATFVAAAKEHFSRLRFVKKKKKILLKAFTWLLSDIFLLHFPLMAPFNRKTLNRNKKKKSNNPPPNCALSVYLLFFFANTRRNVSQRQKWANKRVGVSRNARGEKNIFLFYCETEQERKENLFVVAVTLLLW